MNVSKILHGGCKSLDDSAQKNAKIYPSVAFIWFNLLPDVGCLNK